MARARQSQWSHLWRTIADKILDYFCTKEPKKTFITIDNAFYKQWNKCPILLLWPPLAPLSCSYLKKWLNLKSFEFEVFSRSSEVKAIRELHAKRTLLRKIKESDVHNVQGLPQRHPAAVTATAAKSLALVYSSPAPKTAPKPAPILAPIWAAFSSVQQPKVSYWFKKKKPHPQFCTLTASSIPYVIGGYLYCHKIQIQINSQKVN